MPTRLSFCAPIHLPGDDQHHRCSTWFHLFGVWNAWVKWMILWCDTVASRSTTWKWEPCICGIVYSTLYGIILLSTVRAFAVLQKWRTPFIASIWWTLSPLNQRPYDATHCRLQITSIYITQQRLLAYHRCDIMLALLNNYHLGTYLRLDISLNLFQILYISLHI